jgi:hypothetical protein
MRDPRPILPPLFALGAGLLSGAVGSGVQNVFFSLTKKITPRTPQASFRPPEPAQARESETETVARRIVEGLALRRLAPTRKGVAGELVHFAFGAAWGGLYGIALGAYPRRRGIGAVLLFSVFVWAASDNLMLPALRVAGPPQAYPAKSHAYAIAAHLVYGCALWAAYVASAAAGGRGPVGSAGGAARRGLRR